MTKLMRLAASVCAVAVVTAAGIARAAEEGQAESGGMPQLNPESYPSQLFWMAVSFLVLFLLIWRVAMPRIVGILEDRRNRIDSDLDRASALKKEADETEAAYEAAMAEGRSNAQARIRETTEEGAKKAADEQAKLAGKLASDIDKAEERIAEARNAALKQIEDVAAEAAQAAARQLVGIEVDKAAAKSAVSAAAKERA